MTQGRLRWTCTLYYNRREGGRREGFLAAVFVILKVHGDLKRVLKFYKKEGEKNKVIFTKKKSILCFLSILDII